MKCRICDADISTGKLRCPVCGTIILNGGGITPVSNFEDSSVLLSEIKDEDTKRYDVKYMNYIFGGPIIDPENEEKGYGPGLVIESVVLLGGQPGAGKSTLMLQIADILAAVTKKESLYICAEESFRQIKPRAQRLKLKNIDKIRLVPAMGGGVDLGAIIVNRKPGFVVVDSLQGLVGEDDAASVYTLKMLKEYAENLRIPIIVTQHLTKGQEIAGVNTLQHQVDTVLIFSPDEENEDIRCLEVNPKNRFGRAYIKMYFLMSENGLEAMPIGFEPEDLDEEEEEE